MLNVSRLYRIGALSAAQARAAARFRRDPERFRATLPPTAWNLLHDMAVADVKLEALEQKRDWSARSAKVVLGVLLSLIDEGPTPPAMEPEPAPDDQFEEMRELIEFLTAEDEEVLDVMRAFALPRKAARLLLILMREPGRFVPRETLYRRLYAETPEAGWPDIKIVDVQLVAVRRALAWDGRFNIENSFGGWYRLVSSREATTRSRKGTS